MPAPAPNDQNNGAAFISPGQLTAPQSLRRRASVSDPIDVGEECALPNTLVFRDVEHVVVGQLFSRNNIALRLHHDLQRHNEANSVRHDEQRGIPFLEPLTFTMSTMQFGSWQWLMKRAILPYQPRGMSVDTQTKNQKPARPFQWHQRCAPHRASRGSKECRASHSSSRASPQQLGG
jgi:hypothetical protein